MKSKKKPPVKQSSAKLLPVKKFSPLHVKYSFLIGSLVILFSSVLFLLVLLIFCLNAIKISLPLKISQVYSSVSTSVVKDDLGLTTLEFNGASQEEEFLRLSENVSSQPEFDFVASPDGLQFAYIVNVDGKYAVSLNNNIGQAYDAITFMVFSPDSRRFAYGVKIGSNDAVVLDGKLSQVYDWVFAPYFFTPDSKYFVYKTRSLAGDSLVFNDKNSGLYDRIYEPFVSSDGSKLFYYARKGDVIYRNFLQLK